MKDLLAFVFWLAIVLASLFGYVMNIIKLVNGGEPLGLMIARGIGILAAPLGTILGLFV